MYLQQEVRVVCNNSFAPATTKPKLIMNSARSNFMPAETYCLYSYQHKGKLKYRIQYQPAKQLPQRNVTLIAGSDSYVQLRDMKEELKKRHGKIRLPKVGSLKKLARAAYKQYYQQQLQTI